MNKKKVKVSKKPIRRIISVLLILMVLIGTIVVGVVNVSADSNDRIATYIKLAADGSVTDGDTSGMTEDQLRFLGLYLSNFYIPFNTEIGAGSGEQSENVKKDMVKTLQTKLSFSDDLASGIVETVYGYSRSSLKELNLYYMDDMYGRGENTELSFMSNNYYTFYRIMIGRSDSVFRKYFLETKARDSEDKVKDNIAKAFTKCTDKKVKNSYSELTSNGRKIADILYKIWKENAMVGKSSGPQKYFGYGYEDGNGVKIVASALAVDVKNVQSNNSTVRSRFTPSQLAFIKCLESTNIEMGYGTFLSDFNATDGVDKESFSEINTNTGKTDKYKMSFLGNRMAVDCFGDLIIMGGNHQIVAMPGCINPFVWTPVDSKGEDLSDLPAGSFYNIANSISLSQANFKHGQNMLLSNYKKKSTKEELLTGADLKGRSTAVLTFSILNKHLDGTKDDRQDKNNNANECGEVEARVMRGTRVSEMEDWTLGIFKTNDEFRNFLMIAKEKHMDNYPYDLSWFYTDPGTGYKSGDISDGILIYDMSAPFDSSELRMASGMDTPVLTNVVFQDTLGAYKGSEEVNYSGFPVESFIGDDGNVTSGQSKSIDFDKSDFESLYSSIEAGRMEVPYDASESALVSLYVTYCWACLYDSSSKEGTIGKLGYRFNVEAFPSMRNDPITLDSLGVDAGNMQLETIQNWTYYLLHPTKGFNYVKTLITNKVNHILLGWHSDMVGTNGVGATVGITKYRSNMGYVTMPDLSEINWTNKLIQLYNDCIPFLIVILLILMLIAFIVGALSLQHAIIGLLIFAVFTLLPVPMINGAVSYSNRISQNVYGDKFTYWALVQQESYASAIDEAANATGDGNSSYGNYLRTLYTENEKVYSNQGSESILVKWQAPKKMASLVLTEEDAKTLSGLNETGLKMLNGMINNAYSGQSYVDDEDAVYMYRSYLDINNFSRYIYNSINSNNVKYRSLASAKKNNWRSLPTDSRLNAINNDMVAYMNEGYTNGENFDQTKTFDNQKYIYVPLTSNIINDVLVDYNKIKDFSDSNDMININADIFNFGLPQFNQPSSSFANKWGVETFAATGGITDNGRKTELGKVLSNYSEEDFVGLASYGLYSENPYYYFSWKLYSDGLKADSTGSKEGYKKLLLQKGEGGYFYNTENNGNKELKDFMNMKGLFTYIIPYMKQCNDMVREWDDTFGIYVYDGIPTEEGHWKDMTTDEMKAKYWHNLNVTRLYCIYCPWVDVMYDCSYAKSETINVMGERVTIDDPLDPQKYPSSRPMIFSASEMADYGLSEADLTSVEKKILRCNEQFEERMYELLNYYKFSDITLNSAAAINCAFVFNNTFSENGIFTENHNIYPQSFDLSNFSYDAFLRLILANATSEDLLDATESSDNGTSTGDTSGDFYERLVNKSSTITVIVMLILDVLSVYLIPAFRIFFLVAIFFAAILIVLTSAFRIETSAKFLRKVGMQFVVPLLSFFAATIGFSLIISLFVGVGNNAVTQTGIFISLGDPVVTMLVMIALDLILLFIYWKIIKKVLKYIKGDAKAVGGFVAGVGAAAVGMVAGAVAAGAGSAQDAGRGASRRLNNWRNRRLQKKGNKSLEEIAQNGRGVPAQDGTGVESGRANERGSGRSAEYAEEAAHNRDLQKDKGETIDSNKAEDSEERKAEIDAKAEKGNIEGSENSSNGLSNGRKNDKVDSKHSDAVSDKEFSARDKVSERASGGNTVGNKSQEGAHRGGKTPREKVGSGSGYSADDYDRAQARKKGVPSTKKEGSAAVKSNSGLDYGNRKTTFATPKNRQGNNRATDRGNKPVDSKPKREKAPSKPKDRRINGGK